MPKDIRASGAERTPGGGRDDVAADGFDAGATDDDGGGTGAGSGAAPSYRLNRYTTPEGAGAEVPDGDLPPTFAAQQTLGDDDRGQRGAGGGVGANGDETSTRGHSGGHDGAGGYGLDGAGGNLAQFTATPPDTHEEVGGRGGDGGANPLMDFQRETIAGTEHPAPGENNPTAAPGTGPYDRADAAVGEKHGRAKH